MSAEIPIAEARRRHAAQANGRASAVQLEPSDAIAFDLNLPYLIKDLISPADFVLLFGPSGCGKTFLTLDLGHAVATGSVFFGRRIHQAPVALFSLEGSAGLSKRLQAVRTKKGDAASLYVHRRPLALLGQPVLADEIILAVNEIGAKLVIIDTLSRSMAGGQENSPEDMTRMIGLFDRIRAATGAAVMVVHHTGKDETRGARGHNSLRAAADAEIEVAVDPAGQRTFRITKARDGADGHEHGFKLVSVPLGTDDDGDVVTSCVVEEVEASEAGKRPKPKLSDRHAMVLKHTLNLLGDPDHTETVAVRCGSGPRVMAVRREALAKELQAAGQMDTKPGEAMNSKDRGKLRDALAALERKGLLGSNAEHVWKLGSCDAV